MPLEFEQVGGLGAAPTVDALVVVADDTDIRTLLARKQADKLKLKLVRVLELVDEDVTVTCTPLLPGLGMVAQ